jgi:hypothetical protein
MMTEGANRRAQRRIALLDDFHVLDGQTGELLGYVRDISSQGLMVCGVVQPAEYQIMRVVVVLPEPLCGKTILQLDVACKWQTRDDEHNAYKSGFQFLTLSELDRDIVRQIQERYEFSLGLSIS